MVEHSGTSPINISSFNDSDRSVAWIGMQALFWGATLGFFVLFFGREAESYLQSLLFVALLLPVAMGTTYFVNGFLVPRFLLVGRYGRFALYGVYTLIVSIYLELVVLVASFILLADYRIAAMNPATLDVFGLVVALYVVVFIALASNLAFRWHHLRAEHDKSERARLRAELELKQAELARLKSQMQPHFLFNTLNNLYGLTLERSDDAPDVVLRISSMLDYVLYGCERPLVPLRLEVEHLESYLSLERLRYDDRLDVQFNIEGDLRNACVAPLLLTPFVENSFKHGAAKTTGASWIAVKIRTSGGTLVFEVENGKPVTVDTSGTSASRNSGIGLENVKRRLGLLYPGDHELRIDDERGRYSVRLSVPIHPCPKSAELEEPS